jgi:hypothetical protein
MANKRREARFMIFTIELGLVPSLERGLQRKIKEDTMWVRLDADTTNNLPLGCAWLILQGKITLEEGEMGGGPGKVALTEVNRYGDMENGVRVEMNQFNLVVVEESMDKFVGRKF